MRSRVYSSLGIYIAVAPTSHEVDILAGKSSDVMAILLPNAETEELQDHRLDNQLTKCFMTTLGSGTPGHSVILFYS